MVEKQSLVVKIVRYPEATVEIQSIRQTVFQIEQHVAPSLDFDGLDADALHVIAYWHAQPAGTARLRYLNPRLAKIERVAVLSAFRGQGIGQAVMEYAIAFLDQQDVREIKLNAQVQTMSFYEKLGFQSRGEEFEEAGIWHIEMYRSCS